MAGCSEILISGASQVRSFEFLFPRPSEHPNIRSSGARRPSGHPSIRPSSLPAERTRNEPSYPLTCPLTRRRRQQCESYARARNENEHTSPNEIPHCRRPKGRSVLTATGLRCRRQGRPAHRSLGEGGSPLQRFLPAPTSFFAFSPLKSHSPMRSQHTPSLRATPLFRGDSSHRSPKSPLKRALRRLLWVSEEVPKTPYTVGIRSISQQGFPPERHFARLRRAQLFAHNRCRRTLFRGDLGDRWLESPLKRGARQGGVCRFVGKCDRCRLGHHPADTVLAETRVFCGDFPRARKIRQGLCAAKT